MKLYLGALAFLAGASMALAIETTTTIAETLAEARASVTTKTATLSSSAKSGTKEVKKTEQNQALSVKSSSTDVEEVIAQGYGRDHAAAMADACTQAVSQVCGAEVVKKVHSLLDVSVESGGTMYDGILLSYRVLEDVKKSDGTYAIKIKAQVKPPAADMFSDKIAVVLPPAQKLQATCASANLKQESARNLAGILESALQNAISEDARFVLLDRSSSLAQAERKFATSSQTSRKENQKYGNMKVADFVIDITLKKGDETMSVREFKVAKRSKYTYAIDVVLELQLVDVVTGGIAARESVSVQRNGSAWQEDSCVQKVMDEFKMGCRTSIQLGLDALFAKISK